MDIKFELIDYIKSWDFFLLETQISNRGLSRQMKNVVDNEIMGLI